MLSLKCVLDAEEAIRSCCLMGAGEESCCETWETRLIAEERVREDMVGEWDGEGLDGMERVCRGCMERWREICMLTAG